MLPELKLNNQDEIGADFKLCSMVEQKYNINCLGIITIFIHSPPIFRGSNIIGQINIVIKKKK